ncbi:uncharacterized protein LOC107607511 [Arachis ipaensis]|uniref:uncharacterized protein LOC107607511 n=1 Tax=Arachis ipaensis TaxID=130454 RepID=UPI0007AF8D0F|nr:uncharacterized protein LOC107607511 [Arachis ipaensis]
MVESSARFSPYRSSLKIIKQQGTLEAALNTIWRQPEGFRILDHGGNKFQFFFKDEIELLNVEKGVPWLFKNYILNLKRWKEDSIINDVEFSHVPIWVQLWGLSEQCKTKGLGKRVGETLEKVMDVAVFSMKGKKERILKIQILLDITKPLRRKIRISGSNNKIIDLQLKYVRIGNFCYCCGCIGHEIRACSENLANIAQGGEEEAEWGAWLRANQFGRRVEDQKENNNPNQPNAAQEDIDKQKKPIPVNLIREFASLFVQDQNSQIKQDDQQVQSGQKMLIIERNKGGVQKHGKKEIKTAT